MLKSSSAPFRSAVPSKRKSQALPSNTEASSSVFTDRPLKANRPLGSLAEPSRLITLLFLASLPTINKASNSWLLPEACITRSAPMVTKGPISLAASFDCFNAAGAVSVMAKTGFVTVIVLGRPGIFRSGRETDRSRFFNCSTLAAPCLKVEALTVPTIGITVSDTPPEAISEPIPLEPLMSRSARRLKPACKV